MSSAKNRNMQLERLYQNLWLFFPLRLHLGYSVALLAIDWWDPWWSLRKKLVLPAPDVLFDLLTFPEANLQDPLWTDLKAELVDPTMVNLGMWPCDRNERAQEEEWALRGPDHQTTCAQIHQIPHTHRRKWNSCNRAQANTSIGDKVPVEDLEDEYILHV